MSETGFREPNRRTVSKGIAWSVPIISAAAVAPFAAASPSFCATVQKPTTSPQNCSTNRTVTTVDFSTNGEQAPYTLTHYIQYLIPAGSALAAGQRITFTYQLTVPTSVTAPTITSTQPNVVISSATVETNVVFTIVLTITAPDGGLGAGQHSTTLSLSSTGVNAAASFALVATTTNGTTCSVPSPNFTSITIPSRSSGTPTPATYCKDSANDVIYYY